MQALDGQYYLSKKYQCIVCQNKVGLDASLSAYGDCRHLEISLVQIKLSDVTGGPLHILREQTELSCPGSDSAMIWEGMVAATKTAKSSFNLQDKKHQETILLKYTQALTEGKRTNALHVSLTISQRAVCHLSFHCTLPSEPHMSYLGREPDTYDSATQKGQFCPHG